MSDQEDRRPWGRYTVLLEEEGFKVKRIEVLPGKRLSLQRHGRRSEHWHVVKGTARVTVGEGDRDLEPGESVDIPTGEKHRVENVGGELLLFVEIQRGDYLGEDDIERFEDDFGRVS
jgi:mannose-6-phosphate isomerase-like protein (cupin superfamily)